MEHGAWSKERWEVGQEEDSNAEVGMRNVEFFSVLMANGLNRQNRPNWRNALNDFKSQYPMTKF